MKILITENKLQSFFNGMMSEYTDMVDHERDYDYYDHSKGRYSYMGYTPINFYMDDDQDTYDSDNFVLQYARNPPFNEPMEGFKTPLLMYSRWHLKSIMTMFEDKFEDLLKSWFELTYEYPVKQVINYHEADEFLRH